MRRLSISLLFCLITASVTAQGSTYPINTAIDVLHYEFRIGVTDLNDSISGAALITLAFKERSSQVSLDLYGPDGNGKGMTVRKVVEHATALDFTQVNNRVEIKLNRVAAAGDQTTIEIIYAGVPDDGLIISKNKYGHRTFFADNWPNRAHHWIPCKDHLSDKATVDFIVTAPDHYQVISNGLKEEETELANHMRLTHWKEGIPLATKLMVIGLADFAVNYPGTVNGIPLSSWVYPEDREPGFYDYAQAGKILSWYSSMIGPYSYEKLANVQSRTIFGGMENASAIFYDENTINGKRTNESLLAHEIAHQWFGDAATETDWPHLWLSEGFATEMTHLYLEHTYGRDTLVSGLKADRSSVIAFTKRNKKPVVDTTESSNLMALLNANSYQKGGWVLQMLREELGDSIFWKGIRQYYASYRGRNASTRDLQHVLETVSGRSLATFFTQWLYTAENPNLRIQWIYDTRSGTVEITVTQLTEKVFEIPLDLGIQTANGKTILQRCYLSQKTNKWRVSLDSKPQHILADPNCRLLFEGKVEEVIK